MTRLRRKSETFAVMYQPSKPGQATHTVLRLRPGRRFCPACGCQSDWNSPDWNELLSAVISSISRGLTLRSYQELSLSERIENTGPLKFTRFEWKSLETVSRGRQVCRPFLSQRSGMCRIVAGCTGRDFGHLWHECRRFIFPLHPSLYTYLQIHLIKHSNFTSTPHFFPRKVRTLLKCN